MNSIYKDTPVNELLDMENIEYKAPSGAYLFVKRMFDIIMSAIALVILSPLFLAIAVAVKLDDGGNVIHRRMCMGSDGKLFVMYKFRSMKTDADCLEKWLTPEEIEAYKGEIKLDNDPRITRVGKFIRKLSIDELPQLLCILQGKMSFVGPRPIIREECENYGDKLPLLLKARPGLTGYWQVNGRSNSTYKGGVRQGLELYYVLNRSLWLDIKIIFKTFKVVFKREGAM